jgi:hypothetical protein
MAALAIQTVGAAEAAGACTDGDRQFPAVGVLLADGATFFAGAPAAGTAGGALPYSYASAGAANQDSQVVKAGPGQVYGWQLFNTAAAARYVKLYDKATAPTAADTPRKRVMLPAGGGAVIPNPVGAVYASGVAFRITTGAADADTGAAAANDVLVNCDYK